MHIGQQQQGGLGQEGRVHSEHPRHGAGPGNFEPITGAGCGLHNAFLIFS